MLQYKSQSSLAKFVIYSLVLHLILFALGGISLLWSKKKSTLLMDIEVAGEGELRSLLEQSQKIGAPEISETIKDIPDNQTEERVIPEFNDGMTDTANNTNEHLVSESNPEKTEDILPATKKVEKTTSEKHAEPIEKNPKQHVKKKKNRKALMNVVKNAEKKRKRQNAARNTEKRNKFDNSFDKMLAKTGKDLLKGDGNISGKGKKGNGRGVSGSGNGLSNDDYKTIVAQIYPHWAVPSGIRDAENIVIEINVRLKDNGEVIPSSVKVVDEKRYAVDYVFRAAADSAKRAVLEASPLKIPRNKIGELREITFCFNLKEALKW